MAITFCIYNFSMKGKMLNANVTATCKIRTWTGSNVSHVLVEGLRTYVIHARIHTRKVGFSGELFLSLSFPFSGFISLCWKSVSQRVREPEKEGEIFICHFTGLITLLGTGPYHRSLGSLLGSPWCVTSAQAFAAFSAIFYQVTSKKIYGNGLPWIKPAAYGLMVWL